LEITSSTFFHIIFCVLNPSITFFFYLIRLLPTSTLFPYTTSSDLDVGDDGRLALPLLHHAARPGRRGLRDLARHADERRGTPARSEEHTSELQSRGHLVCRLLLEKKKRPPGLRSKSHQSFSRSMDI